MQLDSSAAGSPQTSATVAGGSTAPAGPVRKPQPTSNIKDTIESILIAFILAFIFRAFVVEAFVIPTGSMAPTLLGAHQRIRCPDCGWEFDINVSAGQSASDDVNIPAEAPTPPQVYCPNCGFQVAGGASTAPATLPVHYGDRILVLKYIYLVHPPRRWDVIVFKAPASPKVNHYQQNFIKRLVGLPGELVKVLDGDVYVSADDGQSWQIQRKPSGVQDALWRIIYDNDHYPQSTHRQGQNDWIQPWRSTGAGWNQPAGPRQGRIFHFDNTSGAGQITFDPSANGATQSFNDFLAYDITEQALLRRPDRFSRQGSMDDDRFNTVADLRLCAYYRRSAGTGPLQLQLTRHEKVTHTFTAEISADTVKLLHRTPAGETQIGPTLALGALGLQSNSGLFLEMTDVDYCTSLRINGKTVLQTTDADYHPDADWLMDRWRSGKKMPAPQVSIAAENQTCELSHLSLWRDIYYTSRPPAPGGRDATYFDDQQQAMHWGMPDRPIHLSPHEFFVLGDNSPISGDARYWGDPVRLAHEGLDIPAGRVPEQFILGQAVFVYWPAGFQPLGAHWPALVPDFGDMRWIH